LDECERAHAGLRRSCRRRRTASWR
jgi:hypothetical protein